MARTTATQVESVLVADYDGTTDLTAYIDTATLIVDSVVECAAARGSTLSDTRLELIERWLSAHAYCSMDQQYSHKKTQSAAGTYTGKTGYNLDGTKYGQMAQTLDPTGCLASLGKRVRATISWLGKPPSEQIDYVDRD